MSWIEGNEASLPNPNNNTTQYDNPDCIDLQHEGVVNSIPQQDTGPAHSQVLEVEEQEEEPVLKQHGIVYEDFGNSPESNFDKLTWRIQQMTRMAYREGEKIDFKYSTSQQRVVTQESCDEQHDEGSEADIDVNAISPNNNDNNKENHHSRTQKKQTISYPKVELKAVDEFDTSIDVFAMAFPWLFPGGYGGPFCNHPTKLTLKAWLENCTYYEDGRFVMDKAFAFYALNFVNRHSNASQGRFFVNQHNKTFDDLTDLQEAVKNGNYSWINNLMYFSSKIKGSVPYWREQRGKIHSWINHHVAEGNGPPTLFITLSCAEYFWKDINRLLKERFHFNGVTSPLDVKDGKYNSVKNVNNMTIVVQEYFQKRVEHWIAKIGRPIFKITDYWLRYEFAPSRGQIHCHMLAITSHNKLLKEAMDKYGSIKNMAPFWLSGWKTASE